MISEKETTRISKFLSLVLRHKPETIGIELDENGWTDVTLLIEKMRDARTEITLEILSHVVATNSKKRFAFDETKTKIRANQGHSVEVELGYEPETPPNILYHGTAGAAVDLILQTGIEKRSRHHVHLSQDVETALKVGERRGKAVIVEVDAAQMHKDGLTFYRSENGVWLTDYVAVTYISIKSL
jgi:putative RNA 2'-phosphotransferase